MKLTYNGGKFTVEFEAEKHTDMFQQIATFQEVFEHTGCGKCNYKDLKFVVRQDKEENNYHELRCKKCSAKLHFGVHKKGGSLFPKRKDKEGNWLPDKGWVKWNQETQKEE